MNGEDFEKCCRQSAERNAKFRAHLDKIYQDERTRLGLDIPETVQSNSISNSKLDDIEKRLDRLERMFKQVEKTSPFIVVSDHKVKLKNENTVPVVMTDEQFKILLNSILR
ncbi:MAG: hypothetical protein MR378_06050 [Ruminococcus sp.]|nr:hypothetical protein [Ruminococcus sp.]